MSTVGYGDYQPLMFMEKMFMTFIILITNAMYAYSVNKIGELLNELEASS